VTGHPAGHDLDLDPDPDPSTDVDGPGEAHPHRVGEVSLRTARNAAIRATAEILGKVATLAWTVAAARLLSQDEFGTVSYALNVMLLASSLAAWGFDTGIARTGSAKPDRLDPVYLGSQLWKTGIAVVVFAATIAFLVLQPDAGPWPVLVLMVLAGFPELWSLSARAAASAQQKSSWVSSALVAQRLVTAGAILAALFLGLGATGVATGFLVGTLVGWGFHHVVLRRMRITHRLRDLRRPDLAEAVRGTFLLGVSGLVLMLLFRVDVFLLGQIRSTAEVAVYSVAYRLLETVLFVTYAINYAVFPVMSATGSATRRRLGYERAMAVAAFVYLPFVVVCLTEGRSIIELLFGSQYAAPAAPVLAWLAPAPLFLAAAFFGNSVLAASGRSRSLLLASSLALTTNVVLNLLLIPPYGGQGAAASTSVAYVVQTAVVLWALRGAERPRLVAALTSSAVAALALAGLLVLLALPLPVELVLGAAVYLGVWLLVVRRVAPEQRDVVVGVLRRKVGRR